MRFGKEAGAADLEKVSLDLRIQFEKHPYAGARALEPIRTIPKEVATIVAQHHENVHGTGFPKKLLRSDIFPMARIVSFVDEFTERLLEDKPGKRKSPMEVIDQIEKTKSGHFDESAILALRLGLTAPSLSEAKRVYRQTLGL